MTEGEGISTGIAKEPYCKMVAEWLVDGYNNILEETRRNVWKKKGFSCF
jgi:hypothetical protein